jgi:hypothetical protein
MARPPVALYAPVAVVSLLLGSAALPAPMETDRVIRAAEGFERDRSSTGLFGADRFKEIRSDAASVAALSKGRAAAPQSSTIVGDHWIYDADAALYDDFDADGYYRFISVRIDADTFFSRSFVYAVIYLSADGEWFDHFYSTQDFEINGATSDDEYFVEVELVSGYPSGRYDVLVELYDADLGLYMDEFGPEESPTLGLLPLEDASFDEPAPPVIVVEEHGGGGAMSIWMLLVLLGLLLVARLWEVSRTRSPVARARQRRRLRLRRLTFVRRLTSVAHVRRS